MSVLLRRHAGLEMVAVEEPAGIDGQGKPSYGASSDILGRVVCEDTVARASQGEEVKAVATIWIDGAQDPLPEENWRVTTSAMVGIVVERQEGRVLAGAVDHVRVKLIAE